MLLCCVHTLIRFFALFSVEMSEDKSASHKGTESLSMEIKTMMSNMFAEFKTDIMQSVTENVKCHHVQSYSLQALDLLHTARYHASLFCRTAAFPRVHSSLNERRPSRKLLS